MTAISAAMPMVISLLAFAFVATAVLAIGPVLVARGDIRRRLPQTTANTASSGESLRQDRLRSFWTQLVKAVESRGLSLADTKGQALRARLISAGYTHPVAPQVYVLVRIVLTLALPTLFLTTAFAGGQSSFVRIYLTSSVLALAGLYIPSLWVSARASRRQQEIINGFPDTLDLMLVCVEAGLGIDAAFNRVGAEIGRSHPLLAELFAIVVLELRAGRSREDALRHLAERAGVPEIRAFTTLLIQSEKLGTSISQTLRVYAAEMRERRRMRAEEKAHKLPVLISIPLVCCMLPTMISVLMLPAAIRVVRTLIPAMAGG